MHQLLQPAAFEGVGEHDPAEGGPVDRHTGIGGVILALAPAELFRWRRIFGTWTHPFPIALQHRQGSGASWGQGLAGEAIRIEHRQAMAFRQQAGHRALAAGDAAGEADPPLSAGPAGPVELLQPRRRPQLLQLEALAIAGGGPLRVEAAALGRP